MEMLKQTIRLAENNVKREFLFFSKMKLFKSHLKKHFADKSERWLDSVPETEREEYRKILRACWDISSVSQEYIEKAYLKLAHIIFQGITISAGIPVYAVIREEIERPKKHGGSFTSHKSSYCFLCWPGYIVYADDQTADPFSSESGIVIRTAYRPIRTSRNYSHYKQFRSSWLYAKRKLQKDLVINQETGVRKVKNSVRYISKENWSKCPTELGVF